MDIHKLLENSRNRPSFIYLHNICNCETNVYFTGLVLHLRTRIMHVLHILPKVSIYKVKLHLNLKRQRIVNVFLAVSSPMSDDDGMPVSIHHPPFHYPFNVFFHSYIFPTHLLILYSHHFMRNFHQISKLIITFQSKRKAHCRVIIKC